jgi:hypothetical protein
MQLSNYIIFYTLLGLASANTRFNIVLSPAMNCLQIDTFQDPISYGEKTIAQCADRCNGGMFGVSRTLPNEEELSCACSITGVTVHIKTGECDIQCRYSMQTLETGACGRDRGERYSGMNIVLLLTLY